MFDHSQPLLGVNSQPGSPCSPTTQGWPGKQYLLSGISVALVPHSYFTKTNILQFWSLKKKTPKSAKCSYFLQNLLSLKKDVCPFEAAIFWRSPFFSIASDKAKKYTSHFFVKKKKPLPTAVQSGPSKLGRKGLTVGAVFWHGPAQKSSYFEARYNQIRKRFRDILSQQRTHPFYFFS